MEIGRDRAARVLRTRAYRAFTKLTPAGIERLRGRPGGPQAIAVAQRLLAGGVFAASEGPAAGLLFSTDHVGLTHIQAHGLARGNLEPAVQEAFRRTIAPGATVFDVGANIGFFSLFAARLTGPQGRVIAFEPSPANAAALRANVALNGAGGVVAVREEAVAERTRRGRLLEVEEESWSHLADRPRHARTQGETEVAVVSLDDLVGRGELAAPEVVKIDVEGSEIAVLEGMAGVLADHRPVLVVELHETNEEVADLLDAAGYSAENLDGTEPIRAAPGGVHVLARRAG